MGESDDFLVSSHVDYSMGCDYDQTVLHRGTAVRAFAVFSIAAYTYLFWMYFIVKTPVLKRHPTRLAIYGCLIEMGYFQQYLWLPTVGKDYLYSDDAIVEPFYCTASNVAGYWAFISQFCMIGVQMCFLIISVDLRLAYTNPFSSYKNNRIYFAALVIGFSLFTAFCLLAMGPRVYGYDEHGIIWIQNTRYNQGMNWGKVMCYYLPIGTIYMYALWANFQFYRSNEKGLSVTISNRLSIMNRSKRFVMGHIFIDCFILFLEFLQFLFNNDSYKSYQVLLSIPSYMQAARGVLGLIVIIYSNWDDVTWQNMNPFTLGRLQAERDKNIIERVALEGLSQQPHLNTALRAEILYFCTQGIMFAARDRGGLEDGTEAGQGAVSESVLGEGGEDSMKEVDLEGGVPQKAPKNKGKERTEYGFDAQLRPSVMVDTDAIRAGKVPAAYMSNVKTAATPAGNSTGGSSAGRGSEAKRDTYADLTRFHKAQDEASERVREEAFANQLEQLGMARGSVSFYNADKRNVSVNSASVAATGLAFGGGGGPAVGGTLIRSNTTYTYNSTMSSNRASGLASINAHNRHQAARGAGNLGAGAVPSAMAAGGGESRNPLWGMLFANQANNNHNSSGNRVPRSGGGLTSERDTDIEMRDSSVGGGRGAQNQSRNQSRMDSTESNGTTSTESTVKWRDTMDVEFSMGRVDNGSKQGPDSWYRVPTVSKHKKSAMSSSTRLPHTIEETDSDFGGGGNSAVASSDIPSEGRSTSSNTAVARVRSALFSAFENAQNLFNPAFKEFRFKDFSPGLFARVRDMCQITAEDYATSFEATCKETFSEGRSGAFMFFSSDQRCIAKSTTKDELLSLQRLMPHYVEYLTKNPNSLISRFLGAHCITMYGVELHFVVMLNFFPTYRLSERFDLKGSWENRHGLSRVINKNKNRPRAGAEKTSLLYLDNDLQHKMSLQQGVAPLIMEQIFKDVEFLKNHNKMDYSLLIGVKKERFEVMFSQHQLQQDNDEENPSSRGGSFQTPGGGSGPQAPSSTAAAAPSSGSSVASGVSATPGGGGSSLHMRPTIGVTNGRLTDFIGIQTALMSSGSKHMSSGSQRSTSPHRGGSGPQPISGSSGGGQQRVLTRTEDDYLGDRDEDGGLHTRYVEGPAKYFIGIIDVLQEWNLQKQLERLAKVLIYGQDPNGISAMAPEPYSKRFLKRCVLDTFEGLEDHYYYAAFAASSNDMKDLRMSFASAGGTLTSSMSGGGYTDTDNGGHDHHRGGAAEGVERVGLSLGLGGSRTVVQGGSNGTAGAGSGGGGFSGSTKLSGKSR